MAVPPPQVTPSATVASASVAPGSSVSGATASVTAGATGGASISGNSSSTLSIPQTAAAGGILMTQPPQTATVSFYKIAPSNPITFGWNLTSLYVYPSSLTVSAVCTANGFTYPVGSILPGTATQVVWDPWAYEQSPGVQQLAQETYTLHINDERGPTALGTPGMFSAYSGLKFALYKPGSATPLSDWQCAGCGTNAAYVVVIQPGFIALLVTTVVMFLSGWSVIRRGLAAH
ncbi:hypothetical protein FRB96_000335 [Tulasnella sp. 330]|nr:hypothetical protein FRB96_000335 [Tulasnella sp. 330]